MARFPRSARPIAFACALAFSAALPCGVSAAPPPELSAVLAAYQKAAGPQRSAQDVAFELTGTLEGEGLSGTFHLWHAGERERYDAQLGLRSERTFRSGDRLIAEDANGNVRRLTGVLMRRARTQEFIDSGEFARTPGACVLRGPATIGKRKTYALDVTAPQGDTQTLYLDAASGLPVRVAFADDDGRTTIDFADYHVLAGRPIAFRSVQSDGNHAYDEVSIVTSAALPRAIAAGVFVPPEGRAIDMAAPETLPLYERNSNLFVDVQIAGRTYRFLLDTGSQNVLLDASVARDAGLAPQGSFEGSGAARVDGLQIARLPELRIGSARLRNLLVTVVDLHAAGAGASSIDGILGYPFFAEVTARFDANAGTMTFGPPGSFVVVGERIGVQLDREIPEAQLRINSVPGLFLFDTGNAGDLLLYGPFVALHPGIVPFSQQQETGYGLGGTTQSYPSIVDELDLGSLVLTRVSASVMLASAGAFADRFDAGNVGIGTLRRFNATFDYEHEAVFLDRRTPPVEGR